MPPGFPREHSQKEFSYTSDPKKPGGGMYGAYRRGFNLKIYDWSSRRFIGQHHIEGEAPPEETTVLGSHKGAPPEIGGFLEDMPLRS